MNKYVLKKAILASVFAIMLSSTQEAYAKEDIAKKHLIERLRFYKGNSEDTEEDIEKDIMEQYLEEELQYYKEHPEAMEIDVKKDEIVIDNRGDTYRKCVSHSIIDIENEFADLGYIHVTSVGNESSNGDGEFTQKGYGIGYYGIAVVAVDADAEYPFAVAKYDAETNTVGDFIGWFKDEDVYARFNNYAEVIEMPISKYITYGNIYDFDVDKNGVFYNFTYSLPYEYTPLVDNYRYGIMIDYTRETKEGYYSNYSQGLYISKEKESSRAKLDDENLELVLKLNIKK